MKRVIVAGGRDFKDEDFFNLKMNEVMAGYSEAEIISGHASGADTLAERYAKANGYQLHVKPADWKRYGRAAGPIRNKEMLEYAKEVEEPILIAFWDGKSKGTKNMIEQSRKAGFECYVFMYGNN